MPLRTAISFGVLIAMIAPARAQGQRELPIAATSIEFTDKAPVVGAGQQAAFESVRWRIGGLVPIPVHPKTVLVLTPAYRLWSFASDDAEGIRVHDISLLSTVRRQVTSKWAVSGTFGVGLATDFKDVDMKHGRLSGAVSGEVRLRPDLTLGFGLAGSYVFGDLLPVPLVVVDWLPTSRLRVFALLPQHAGVGFRVLPRLEVSLVANVDGNRFSVQTNTPAVENIKLSRGAIRTQLAVRVAGKFWALAYAGSTFFRRLQAFDDANNELADLGMERSAVYGLAIQLRIPLRRPDKSGTAND